MEPDILRVTPFNKGEGFALAAVRIGFGPVFINTKLMEKDGRYFLSMPSRKKDDDTYFVQADIEDRKVYQRAVERATEAYHDEISRRQMAVAAG